MALLSSKPSKSEVEVEVVKMRRSNLIGLAVPLVAAIPAPTEPAAAVANVANVECQPTVAPELSGRGIVDDVKSYGEDVKSYVGSLASDVASDVASFVNSGILDFPSGFPIGGAVQSALGVSSSDLDAVPTQVLNLPYVPPPPLAPLHLS